MRNQVTWGLGRRELIAMVTGALLYGGLNWVTNMFGLVAAQIRPGVAVPVVFGFVFGPVVGFVTGALGNFISDGLSGFVPYGPAVAAPTGLVFWDLLRNYLVNWQIGNGLMGFIPGLAALLYNRYFSVKDQFRAMLFAIAGIIVGIGFAAFTQIYVQPGITPVVAINVFFLPTLRMNVLNAVILVPLLLFNYERIDLTSTDWLHSGLMRRLLLAILTAAVLPVFLLGLFLAQQATTDVAAASALTFKLAFTIVITFIFTLANALLVAQSMSLPLLRLSRAAQDMEAGNYTLKQAAEMQATPVQDEVSQLTHIFGHMAQQVIVRYDEVQQRNRELDSVYKIAQAITASSNNPDDTLKTILEQVEQMIPCAASEICLFLPEQQVLQVRACHGRVGSDIRGRTYQIGEGFTGWIGQHRQSLLVADIDDHPTLTPVYRSLDQTHLIHAYVGVPLLVEDKLVGMMDVVDTRVGAFDEHTQHLLETIAPQAAIAIDTAQRVEARERQLKEQIAQLRIEIDEVKRQKQVSEIVDTDFFQDIRSRARAIRERKQQEAAAPDADQKPEHG